MVQRKLSLLNDTRMGDKSKDIWLDWRQLLFISLLLLNIAIGVNAGGENSGESGESLSRQKRDDCECAGSEMPLKCRCHSGEDAYDQICRCARSIMPSCGCPFRNLQQNFNMAAQSMSSPCKGVCERSCINSCTAQLQPVSQCAATCTFTCDKTCGQFQVSIQQLQAAGNKNQAIPHVLILGGTQSPPTCKCPQAEPNCPCNCLPRCQQNCQQNCQANGQPISQCSNTCSQTCQSTCLANSIVQETGVVTPAPSPIVKSCTQQCPNSCQKVCIKLQPTMPMCQQNCVQTCNNNCMNIPTATTTTEAAPTPPPYIPAAQEPLPQQPSRDCTPVCQPACLKSCTSVYQQQEQQQQQQQQQGQQIPTATYGGENNALQFGYLYGTPQTVQKPGMLPGASQPVAYQTSQLQQQQQPQYVQPQQVPQQYNYASQPQIYAQPQAAAAAQLTDPTRKLVTVTICVPQCMPACESSCIQNVANALQQHHQQQQQALQAQQTTVTCPAQCEPDCRPTCIQSVIQQTQAQQSIPLPAGSFACPTACMPRCEPSCLINQAPNYLTSSIQQSLNPRGLVLPSQSNYGHLQATNQQSSKFSMLNNQPTTTAKPSGPKTCVSYCMPLCLDECVNAGAEEETKSDEITKTQPTITFSNINNNNKPLLVFPNLKNQANQTNLPNQIFLNLNHNNNNNQTQSFIPRQNSLQNSTQSSEPMRVMIHYTSEPKSLPSTTTTTTSRPFFQTMSTSHPPMHFPKIMPASLANIQKQPSIDPFDPSKLAQQKPNPHFHIGTSSTTIAPPPPSTPTTPPSTVLQTTTTSSSAGKSLTEIIRQKCESSCEKVCNAECKKQKDPPDEACVLICKKDCVTSCSRKFNSKIFKTKA